MHCYSQLLHRPPSDTGSTFTRGSVSSRNIQRRLVERHLASRRPLSVLPLTPTHRRLRCHAQGNWTAVKGNQVVLSDLSRFNLSIHDNLVRLWRPRGESLNPVFALQRHTASTVGVMVWGAVAYNTRSPLLLIHGTITTQRYVREILQPHKLLGAVDTRRYPRAENRVWSDQEDHEERGSKDRAATLVDPTVTRSTIRADVGVAIVPQKISRYLAEANLKIKRPFRALPLTPEHRQLRLQWCQARSTWNVTDWQKVVFSNESWFVFGTDDNRVRVLRRPGERYNPSHTVPRHTARTACVMVWGAIAYNSRST
ncbi:transposable element Tcb2 transposase [Trichonephila clavipes]|nr:transposable element Tcb2 transposase [Trichonephila clavipes]